MEYSVKILPAEASYNPSALSKWLNEKARMGWELIAIDGRNYIFGKNITNL